MSKFSLLLFRKKLHKLAFKSYYLSIQEWREIYTCRKINNSYDVHCVYCPMWLYIWGLHWKDWQLILFNILNLICRGDWLWTCKDPPSSASWMRRLHNKFYPPRSSLLCRFPLHNSLILSIEIWHDCLRNHSSVVLMILSTHEE